MLMGNGSFSSDILANNITEDDETYQIRIVSPDGRILQSTIPDEVGNVMDPDQTGCVECHLYPKNDRPNSIRLDQGIDKMRVSLPITNELKCQSCHPSENEIFGSLLVDISMETPNSLFQRELLINILSWILSLGVILLFTFLLIKGLNERRIGLIESALSKYASGDDRDRIENILHVSDENTTKADTYESMADKLDLKSRELEERTVVRENAILEERERIGRELHDGIAQFLGYIITKSRAVSLLLEKNQIQQALIHLKSMEEETQKQAIDVRASVLGLNSFTQQSQGLAQDFENYLENSNRFMEIKVETDIDPHVNSVMLGGETRLQLLRILQESISNIRKHSQAQHAWVTLKLTTPELLEMIVRDDGVGFDPNALGNHEIFHFGLKTMQERARSISASFEVATEYNRGTSVHVKLFLQDRSQ